MNKNAIKKFAIDARNKLIASVTDKAGMLGITPDNCSEAITKGADFEVYKTAAGTELTLNKKQCEQRRKLVDQIHARGFEAVVEEVAYTWFNRICAIRFMEVNDYMYPVRIRVLSSEKEGKNEPDVVTMAPEIDWDFTDKEREEIIDAKMNNRLDDLFRMLFIKQCNLLHEVLPGLFEETEDYTEMLLNISFTNEDDVIRMLVDGIDEKDFNITTVDEDGKAAGQVEIIGWLYQYYNTEPKNKAFAKKAKITKEEVPAVTQLFTPDWIVRYMVENSLGRMWVEGHPDDELKSKWKYYLDEAEQEESVQQELNRIKAEYATLKPEDIKLIDPCMGSGHILVYAFDVFMQIYENAGWSQRDAAQSIIQNNIYGLDIDDRAAQLSYFAVLMKARQYDRRILTREIEPNVYAVQESNGINCGQLKYFGTGLTDAEKNAAVSQIEELLNTLNDAKEYGSLLNVEDYDWELLEKFVENTDTESQISFETYGLDETAEQLKRLIRIGKVMAQKYEVVVTNPPYMGNKGMNQKLSKFLQEHYLHTKYDLFAAFIEKGLNMTKTHCNLAMITQNSWMSGSRYENARLDFLTNSINSLIHLGTRAFDEIGGEVVQTVAFCIGKMFPIAQRGKYIKLTDVAGEKEKEKNFFDPCNMYIQSVDTFLKMPSLIIGYWVSDKVMGCLQKLEPIEINVFFRQGMATSDNNRFLRQWQEVNINKIGFGIKNREEAKKSNLKWFPYNKGGSYRKWYGNNELIVNWENDGAEMKAFTATLPQGTDVRLKSKEYYFKEGFTWSALANSVSVRYCPTGFIFDTKGSMGFPYKNELIRYFIGLINSNLSEVFLEVLAPTLDFNLVSMKQIPMVIDRVEEVTALVDECILLSQRDWDNYETSWDFEKHPLIIEKCTSIEDAYTIWNNECRFLFSKVKETEEKLNSIFAEIYGIEDEVSNQVPTENITIHLANKNCDIKSLISYAIGCIFGRYSLDKNGLVYAGGEWDDSAYATFAPDKDNIIPICDEEYFSDDIVSRFCEWVKIVYGEKSLETNLDFIAKALGNKGNTSREVIRNYFLNDFFKDHCNTYSVTGSGKRPIYWMFDSGKQNGFKALIYMHRYDADTVGRVRTDYLHRAQKYVETAMQSAQYTIDNAASASEKSKATKAVTKYTKQLAEMKIYDEAIAHVANQRIEIDLDDGVKVNYAKFQGVEVAQEGKKTLKIDLLAKI